MVAETVDVAKSLNPSPIDEFCQGFASQTVDIHAVLRHKPHEFAQFARRTRGIRAVQSLRTAFGRRDFGRRPADRANGWNLKVPNLLCHFDDFRNDLIGLDDRNLGPRAADAEPLAFGDVAERRALDERTFQLDGAEDRHRGDRSDRAGPLNRLEGRLRRLVLPLERKARARRVVSGHRSRLRIGRVVVADDESVNRERIVLRRHLHGPAVDGRLNRLRRRHVETLAFDRPEAVGVKVVHPRTPGDKRLLRMDKRERNPLKLARLELLDVLERERAAGEIARIGVVFLRFGAEFLEIGIGYHGFAAYDEMPLVFHRLRDAADAVGKVCDVRTDVSVAARHDLREASVVVGDDEREAVQFPLGNPLRLRKGQGGEFMRLLLARHVVRTDFVRRRLGQHDARLLLERLHLVEQRVPFVVGHQLATAVVIGVRRFVQLRDPRAHLFKFLVHILRFRLSRCAGLEKYIKKCPPCQGGSSRIQRGPKGTVPCSSNTL